MNRLSKGAVLARRLVSAGDGLHDLLDSLSEDERRTALVWLVGYAEVRLPELQR